MRIHPLHLGWWRAPRSGVAESSLTLRDLTVKICGASKLQPPPCVWQQPSTRDPQMKRAPPDYPHLPHHPFIRGKETEERRQKTEERRKRKEERRQKKEERRKTKGDRRKKKGDRRKKKQERRKKRAEVDRKREGRRGISYAL